MLKIKLSRAGRRNRPIFRIIVQEDSFDPKGKYIEKVGFIDRITKKFNINKKRVLYWIGKGAKPTDSIKNFLIARKIIDDKKVDISKQARLRKTRKAKTKEEPKSTTTQPTTTPEQNPKT